MDGRGLRPSHPQLIPADDFLGEEYSRNGVLMIGEKELFLVEHMQEILNFTEKEKKQLHSIQIQ